MIKRLGFKRDTVMKFALMDTVQTWASHPHHCIIYHRLNDARTTNTFQTGNELWSGVRLHLGGTSSQPCPSNFPPPAQIHAVFRPILGHRSMISGWRLQQVSSGRLAWFDIACGADPGCHEVSHPPSPHYVQ